jgi:hypothetical protein
MWTMNKSVRFCWGALFCLYLVALFACSNPSPEPSPTLVDVGDDSTAADTGDVVDASDVADAYLDEDASQDVRPEDVSTDADTSDEVTDCGEIGDPCPAADRSTYICNEDSDDITYPPVDEPFRLPNVDKSYEPPYGDTFLERAQSTGAYARTTFTPAPHHDLMVDRPWAIAVERGDDVTVHSGMWHEDGPFDDGRLVGAVMLDYEPVEAHYTVWDDLRQNVLAEAVGTGVNLPATSEVVLVDVTIPAEAFGEDRAYELSSVLRIEVPGRTYINQVQRLDIFYQGYSRPSHPCFLETSALESTQTELDLLSEVRTPIILYPEDTVTQVRGPHEVAPGEELSLAYFHRVESLNVVHFKVVQPIFNGRPVGDPLYMEPTINDGNLPTGHRTSYRDTFSLVAPTEPGLYPLVLAGFSDAHHPFVDHHGQTYVSMSGSSFDSSNTIWFEVVEPD